LYGLASSIFMLFSCRGVAVIIILKLFITATGLMDNLHAFAAMAVLPPLVLGLVGAILRFSTELI
jgi:hypothetical protein